MSPTLDYRLKGAFSLLSNNPDNPCLMNVLIYLILHKNGRGRCWPSTETIAKMATRGDPNKAIHAKRWLIEHDAIKLVPFDKRVGNEVNLPKRQHVFQLTGFLRDGDMIYPYLYLSEVDMDEFRKAAEEIAGDIINQVHSKPKKKRMRNNKFIGIVSKTTYDNSKVRDGYVGTTKTLDSINDKKMDSEIRDVHIIDVPNQSISIGSRYSTTYGDIQNMNNPHTQNSNSNTDALERVSRDILASSPILQTTLPVGEDSSAIIQKNNISSINVYQDDTGEALVDPNLVMIAPNGAVTYICPACRSYVTQEPNQLCLKCRNKGISLNLKTIDLTTQEEDPIKGKYSKITSQKVGAVQKAIMTYWPGKSLAYGWAGKIAQMLVGVSPKSSGDYYLHRLRKEATPDEVKEFAVWWSKHKAAGRKNVELPSTPESLEKFFSEYREFKIQEEEKIDRLSRKYIDIDLSEYK